MFVCLLPGGLGDHRDRFVNVEWQAWVGPEQRDGERERKRDREREREREEERKRGRQREADVRGNAPARSAAEGRGGVSIAII